MVIALAFLATAVATLFAQATLVRYTARPPPHQLAWTISLAMFALASAALATGTSTGWDNGHLPRLLPARRRAHRPVARPRHRLPAPRAGTAGRRVQWGLVFFSGLATGVLFTAPMKPISGIAIPVGKDVFGAFPRVLAAVGSGVGAVVIIGGAVVSASRFARVAGPRRATARLAAANVPHRARHARAVERRADPGHRGQGRGVRAQPRRRDQRDLRRLPRRRGAPARGPSRSPELTLSRGGGTSAAALAARGGGACRPACAGARRRSRCARTLVARQRARCSALASDSSAIERPRRRPARRTRRPPRRCGRSARR